MALRVSPDWRGEGITDRARKAIAGARGEPTRFRSLCLALRASVERTKNKPSLRVVHRAPRHHRVMLSKRALNPITKIAHAASRASFVRVSTGTPSHPERVLNDQSMNAARSGSVMLAKLIES